MSIKMKELPISERPYEKLEMYGAHTLSNAELLAIIIKNGTKEESSVSTAQKILLLKKGNEDNLRFLQDISIEEFMSIKGIGRVKAIQIKAVCELTKRIGRPIHHTQVQINCPQDVVDLLMEELRYEKREIVKTVILNTKNRVLKIADACLGGTSSVILKPRELLEEIIKMGAPKMILLHNHPSGSPIPSEADIEFTYRLKEACDIMGVELLDHIVIGEMQYESIFSYIKKQERKTKK